MSQGPVQGAGAGGRGGNVGSAFVSSPLPSPSVSRRFQVHGEAPGGPRDFAILGSILPSGTSTVKSRILDRWTLGKCFLTTAIIITVLMVYGAVALCWAPGSELYIQQVTASSGAQPRGRWQGAEALGSSVLCWSRGPGLRIPSQGTPDCCSGRDALSAFLGPQLSEPFIVTGCGPPFVHRGKD